MSLEAEIRAYLDNQPKLAWRRLALRRLFNLLTSTVGKMSVSGLENVPESGGVILMMNHITAIDPGVVISACKKRIVIPMTKAEAAEHWFTGPFVAWYGAFTIHRGEVDRKALMTSLGLLNEGQCVLIAPEGTRNPHGLQEPREGMVYLATKTNASIVPVTVSDAIGWEERIKHFQRVPITITFGTPFKFKTDGRLRVPREEMTQMLREAMYQLAITLPDPTLRGIYSDLENATTQFLEFIHPKQTRQTPES